MEDKTQVVNALNELSQSLNKYHEDSITAQFVNESLQEIQKSEAVAFTGALQYFFNKAPVVKLSDGIILNNEEKRLWREVFSYRALGNNLWGASL